MRLKVLFFFFKTNSGGCYEKSQENTSLTEQFIEMEILVQQHLLQYDSNTASLLRMKE